MQLYDLCDGDRVIEVGITAEQAAAKTGIAIEDIERKTRPYPGEHGYSIIKAKPGFRDTPQKWPPDMIEAWESMRKEVQELKDRIKSRKREA